VDTKVLNMALNELIHHLASEDAVRLFHKMEAADTVKLDLVSYNTAITACQAPQMQVRRLYFVIIQPLYSYILL
jgi:hypothetical protein